MKFGIGQAVSRKEDPKFLTGKGRYVDDMVLSRMTHGYVLRSPHANAKIKSIDTSAAEAAPGVIAVFTGAHIEAAGLGGIPCMTIIPFLLQGEAVQRPAAALAKDEVKCVGARVAFVVAETLAQAKDAAELIDVDYEILPAVTTAAAARADGAPLVYDGTDSNLTFQYAMGNAEAVEAALAGAHHVTRARINNNRVTTNSMEARVSLGDYDAGEDRHTLYTTSQGPHGVRTELCHEIFHMPESKLRVVAPDVGGGFGMKGGFYGEDILTVWAAKEVGRPVKWVSDRAEALLSDSQARDVDAEAEMGFDADGKVVGFRVTGYYNQGAYMMPSGGISPMFFTTLMSGVYAMPAIRVTTNCYFTNTQGTAPYRGAGRPEAAYVVERMFDMAAREMDIDSVELRRRNMIKPDQMPYQTALMYQYDCGDFEACMDNAMEAAGWAGFDARRSASEAEGKLRGRGLSVYLESAAVFNDRMEIHFDGSGDVTIVAGTHSHGQGHDTVYAQMASEFLGVDNERVRVIQGDTDKVSIGRGTVGSRSMVVGGSALKNAADEVIEKGKKIAAHLMEAGESDIEFDDGAFTVAGTDKSMDITQVAAASYNPIMYPPHLGVGLEGVGAFQAGLGNFNFPNGCQIAEVEIDPDTGKVELVGMTVTDDVGTVINPLLLKGQLHGGVAQGVGQALMENIVYDEGGQMLSGSFLDYCMPRADDFPKIAADSLPVPTGNNPLGVKGAGETGTVGAPPAVINAVVDALAGAGVTHVDMPATPERIWRALREAA